MTERVRMSFKVKNFQMGNRWICLEPVQEDLVVLANGFLGFDLPPGTTIEKTKKIAEFEGISVYPPIFHLLPLVCGISCHPVAGLTLRASILIALRREFLNLPYGSFIALRLVVVFRMRKERCQCRLPMENYKRDCCGRLMN